MKPLLALLCLSCLFTASRAQNHYPAFAPAVDETKSFTQNPEQKFNAAAAGRKWLVGGASVAGITGSLYLLYKSNNYHYHKKFHTVNDSKAWLQMDKNEHMVIAYTASRLSSHLWQWAGLSQNKAVWAGSATSLVYLSVKEFLDGHNKNWGWSWTDMGADAAGIAAFAAQQLTWKEQKIQLKASAHLKNYEPSLDVRADSLFGTNRLERLVKDYNGQTYWLSCNVYSLVPASKFPAWLNIAIGYGAENLFGAYNNIAYKNGSVFFDRSDLKRYRQWYLAPDIDLTKIKTNSKAVKTLCTVFNSVKIPTPALELSNGKIKAHWLHF